MFFFQVYLALCGLAASEYLLPVISSGVSWGIFPGFTCFVAYSSLTI